MSRALLLLALAACATDTTSPDTAADTADSGDGSLTDPLSMPGTPTLDPSDFPTSAQCAKCHPDQVAQWSTSNHAYAIVDPLFQVLVSVRQGDFEGKQDRFCTQCHSAIGVRGGEIAPGFSFDALSPVVDEGVTCLACHATTSVERDYNSGLVLDPAAPYHGPIADPTGNSFHASAPLDDFSGARFCGACHDVIEPSGLDLERPYYEWEESPAALEGQTCQDCHMPETTGKAATDGPERTVHDHRFVGIENPFGDADVAARIDTLLAQAAAVDLVLPDGVARGDVLPVTVDVTNLIAGHNLPTGSTFIRELWIELVVTDAEGTVLYESGTLGDDGDLRGYWSVSDPYGDPDLVTFGSGFIDADGEPTLFPWRATEHWSAAIPPGYQRASTYFVPTSAAAAGPIDVAVRLRLRPASPHLLRTAGLDDHIPDLPIYELAGAEGSVEAW